MSVSSCFLHFPDLTSSLGSLSLSGKLLCLLSSLVVLESFAFVIVLKEWGNQLAILRVAFIPCPCLASIYVMPCQFLPAALIHVGCYPRDSKGISELPQIQLIL